MAITCVTIGGFVAAYGSMGIVSIQAAPSPSSLSTGADDLQVLETLKSRLLSADSATVVLEAWCAERGLTDHPHLIAERLSHPDKSLAPEQRLRLHVGPDEAVRYRRVRLACGPYVLAEADNWYVPARLTREMNRVLDTTRTPFGHVVQALRPSRRTLYAAQIWTGAEANPPQDERMFTIAAVLSTGDGVPFCEVAETYTGAVLARGRR